MDRLALTPGEAAESIGVCLTTMHKLMRKPGFPALRIGTRWVIPVAAFNDWLKEQCYVRSDEQMIGEAD